MKGKIEMQSNVKLDCYRQLRNQVCSEIAKAEENYRNVRIPEEYTMLRKDLLERISFYKDVLSILSKYKELITDAS